jgi:hypothetical protein
MAIKQKDEDFTNLIFDLLFFLASKSEPHYVENLETLIATHEYLLVISNNNDSISLHRRSTRLFSPLSTTQPLDTTESNT